ncbi:unnamed protein product [Darwinula stevensoni]|uniref:C-type lectin domain-containing protein n=1 Tax=Darwinula stevensoni TaxID=69355 RepID=A0A7R9AD46_9CRUS|nr:unnamed protein product [Darwinula stevensoni]CAG0900708.1 unnamed protein product [Darwinula stevensoni]
MFASVRAPSVSLAAANIGAGDDASSDPRQLLAQLLLGKYLNEDGKSVVRARHAQPEVPRPAPAIQRLSQRVKSPEPGAGKPALRSAPAPAPVPDPPDVLSLAGGKCENCLEGDSANDANWYKAMQFCRYHGMHLASITSQEENEQLEKVITSRGLGNEHFWTSGTDQGEEGDFFWLSTGQPVTYTNWNAGEPNNFIYENGEEEHCLELWNRDGKGLKWNDTPCSFQTYFVCEIM